MSVRIAVSKNSQFRGTTMIGPPDIDQEVTPASSPAWGTPVSVVLEEGAERLLEIRTTDQIEVSIVPEGVSPNKETPIFFEIPFNALVIETRLLSATGKTNTMLVYVRSA